LIALARGILPFMKDAGGCILAMTYFASEKVIPSYHDGGYNVLGMTIKRPE
jgi:enoyl-[acyl-carrier-protein] reductase (NADH)